MATNTYPHSISWDYSKAPAQGKNNDFDAAFRRGDEGTKRRQIRLANGVLNIRFLKGLKVMGTGLELQARLDKNPVVQKMELRYRIKYPKDFEEGLSGKQMGLSGGRGYDGGRGDEARTNKDGWSVRLQFDSRDDGQVRNGLYVYNCTMKTDYGGGLGGERFMLQKDRWHEIIMRVRMQTKADKADGSIEVLCDGKEVIDVKNVQFVAKEDGRNINCVRITSFPGGGGTMPTRDANIQISIISWKPL
jgi:hypothetical protein